MANDKINTLLKRFWKWICKTKTRTLALIYALTKGMAFTVTILIFSACKITVPAELIICVFTEVGVIGLTSGAITIYKLKVGEVEIEMQKSEDNNDEY